MKRVSIEEMEPLEKAAHIVGVEVHGLKCDQPDCGWSDMTIPLDAYADYLGAKCPDCGYQILKMGDFTKVAGALFSHAAKAFRMKGRCK